MFAIINLDTREVLDRLDSRPKKGKYESPLLPVYVTQVEAASLTLPVDEWVTDPADPYTQNLVHTPGTIVSQPVLNNAIARQDQLRTKVMQILTFAQSLNGRSFSSLTTNELKGVVQLLLAMNGMINVNGDLDLSDFTIDDILRLMDKP